MMYKSAISFLLIVLSAAVFANEPGKIGEKPRPDMPPKGHFRPRTWEASGDIFVYMNKLKNENPQEFTRLNELRRTDFKAYIEEMKQRMPMRPELKRIGELKRQEREIAKKIQETDDAAEKERLSSELKLKLKENFDLMLKEAEARLEIMMQRVKAIRENEEQFLQDKYEMLLRNESQGESQPPPPPPAPEAAPEKAKQGPPAPEKAKP